MAQFMRVFLGRAFKSSPSLEFAVLAGCLRVPGESLFRGQNSVAEHGLEDDFCADCFGFTTDEVDGLLNAWGLTARREDVREWYDGYLLGDDRKLSCPWNILRFLKDACGKPSFSPRLYWASTSGGQEIRKMLELGDVHIEKELGLLLDGGAIAAEISDHIAYDSLFSSAENIWTLLYLTGHLTKDPGQFQRQSRLLRLRIPNREVREGLLRIVSDWKKEKAKAGGRKEQPAAGFMQ